MASSPSSVALRLIEQLEQASTLDALSKRIQVLVDTGLRAEQRRPPHRRRVGRRTPIASSA
jgi:hypothetical protein